MPAPGRLESWKEIAEYLGVEETTVMRWAKARGLPVHRRPGGKRPRVYAFTAEIDAWEEGDPGEPSPLATAVAAQKRANPVLPASEGVDESEHASAPTDPSHKRQLTKRFQLKGFVLVGLALAAVTTLGVIFSGRRQSSPQVQSEGTPTAPQGSSLRLRAGGFQPGITVARWSRTPSGTVLASGVLEADAAGFVRWSHTTDCGTTPGSYELWFEEVGTSRRTAAAVHSVQPDPDCAGSLPDLVAEGVVVDPTALRAGAELEVRFAVRNQGTAPAAPSRARLRLGRSGNVSTMMDITLADIEVPAVVVGAVVDVSAHARLPEGALPGTYYLWVVVDNEGRIKQSLAGNDFARSAMLSVEASAAAAVLP